MVMMGREVMKELQTLDELSHVFIHTLDDGFLELLTSNAQAGLAKMDRLTPAKVKVESGRDDETVLVLYF